jgi:DNA modification methylase
MTVTRIHGCILAHQHQIPDDSIDLLLTDPPYNISENGANVQWTDPVTGENKNRIHSQRFDESFEQDWDTVTHSTFIDQLDEWCKVWNKKLRKGGTFSVFISDRYLSYLWTAMEDNGLEPKRVITWKKPAAVPFNRGVNPVSGCEFIVWGIKPGGKRTFNATTFAGSRIERFSIADKVSSLVHKYIRESTDSEINVEKIFEQAKAEAQRVIDDRKKKNGLIECVIPNTITYSGGLGRDKIHPTQKPIKLYKWILQNYAKDGDKILDTHLGSGSIAIACHDYGFDLTACELDSEYYEKAIERIKNHVSQQKLFI